MKNIELSSFIDGLSGRNVKGGGESLSCSVSIEGYGIPITMKLQRSDKLVVFFPGAHAIGHVKPKFQRRKYFDELPYNCVSLFDPTLFLEEDLSLGWFQGGGEIPHFERVKILLVELAKELAIPEENILLFGSSAGGIPAIKVSESIPKCNVFVANPQTDVRKYFELQVSKLIEHIAMNGGLTEGQKAALTVVGTRSSARVIYAQNVQDQFHLVHHFQEFRERRPDFEYIMYDHPTGHSPIGRGVELDIIERILSGSNVGAAYGEFLLAK